MNYLPDDPEEESLKYRILRFGIPIGGIKSLTLIPSDVGLAT